MEKTNTNKRQSVTERLGRKVKRFVRPIIAGTYIFEVSFEVCNKIGGIYTVIQSKVPTHLKKWGKEKYLLIGPYFENKVPAIFEPIVDPSDEIFQMVSEMNKQGYKVHYGEWLILGRPRAILFDLYAVYPDLDKIKYLFWEHHNISIPPNNELIDQVMSFGYQILNFFKLFSEKYAPKNRIVVQFHEWMAGAAIPDLRRENLPVKIIFTTHATLLGRYLAMNDPNYYQNLHNYNWAYEAKHFNVEHIMGLERAAAHGAHVFSTVSNVTAEECEVFLGRKPDYILPNGFNIERFEVLHEFQNLHKSSKEKINEFIVGHFFQSYSFDLDKTLIFFTSGRFEYKNKGYDITLKALAKLNQKLKQEKSSITIVMFFISPRPYHGFKPEVLHSKALMEEIHRNCLDLQKKMGNKLFFGIASMRKWLKFPDLNQLLDESTMMRIRRNLQAWHTNQRPSVVTHNLKDEANDPIMNFLWSNNLMNNEEDRVKIVYHPEFISSDNPLFHMEYYQFIRGCHLGVFPSYYEPWGYTPLECVASGIPSITSDLAGFGSFVDKSLKDHEKSGIFVLKRKNVDDETASNNLMHMMYDFTRLSLRERVMQRNKVVESSSLFGWDKLASYYNIAHLKAIKMTWKT